MTRRVLALVGLLLLVLPVASALAQDDGADLRIESVDVSGYPDVALSVIVSSELDGELEAPSFSLTEDGQAKAIDVEQASSSDLQVVLMLDTTGSMSGEPLEAAKAAARTFVEDLPEDVAVAVLSYDSEPTLVTSFDASRAEHLAGIAGLQTGRRTAMYDAMATAIDVFPAADANANRAIVLLTDGEDNASSVSVDEVTRRLLARRIALYGVEYQTQVSDHEAIRRVATATGGRSSEAGDSDALAGVYQQLAEELVSRYTVTYPTEASGTVEIAVSLAVGDRSTAMRSVELPEGTATATPGPRLFNHAFFGSPLSLAIGGVLWFVALAIILFFLIKPRQRSAQLRGAARASGSGRSALSGIAAQVSELAEQTLRRGGKERGLNVALERAGINLRPGEFAVLVLCGAIAGLVLGWTMGGPFGGIALAGLIVLASRMVLSMKGDKRQTAFAEQLGETLQLLASSLRAGYSLLQAIDAVAREAEAPASEEFHRLVVETRLGRDVNEALHAMGSRLGNEDFGWVLQAIEINREVGGDLAEVLDTVAGTIRDRDQIRRQVQVVSAEGRMSAYVLMALPFAVGLFMLAINPSYMREFVTNGLVGYAMLGAGAAMLTIGGIWLRSMVKVKF
jgi:tight adherence protein B